MGQKKTILVVDDNEEICQLLMDYLQSKDMYSYFANDISAAMKIANEHKVDIVILDDNLMEGTKGVYHIPGFKATNKDIKVIMLTANNKADLKQKAAFLGAESFLVKPVDFEVLDEALKSKLFSKGGVWQ